MKRNQADRWTAALLTALLTLSLTACGDEETNNLLNSEGRSDRVVTLFSPMEKSQPDKENTGI